MSIGALLLDPPGHLQTAKVFDMLLAFPKIGNVKATRILHSCRSPPADVRWRQRAPARRARPTPGPLAVPRVAMRSR
jgi:hypothetical protein